MCLKEMQRDEGVSIQVGKGKFNLWRKHRGEGKGNMMIQVGNGKFNLFRKHRREEKGRGVMAMMSNITIDKSESGMGMVEATNGEGEAREATVE